MIEYAGPDSFSDDDGRLMFMIGAREFARSGTRIRFLAIEQAGEDRAWRIRTDIGTLAQERERQIPHGTIPNGPAASIMDEALLVVRLRSEKGPDDDELSRRAPELLRSIVDYLKYRDGYAGLDDRTGLNEEQHARR